MSRGGRSGVSKYRKSKLHQRMQSFEQQHALHYQQRQYQETIILSHLPVRNSSYPANAPTHIGPQSMHVSALHSNDAQVGERAQHNTLLVNLNLSTLRKLQLAACSLQQLASCIAAALRPTGDIRILSISVHIGPLGAPFALSILDILVGRPLSAWP